MEEPVDNVVQFRSRAYEELERTGTGIENPVWDACEVVLGYGPRTKSEKALWGKITTSLRDAEATPEEIEQVAEFYRKHWPQVDLTITALEKWFSHFLGMRSKKIAAKARPICHDCGLSAPNHTSDCKFAQS